MKGGKRSWGHPRHFPEKSRMLVLDQLLDPEIPNVFWILGLLVANQMGSTLPKYNKAVPGELPMGMRSRQDGP